MKEEFNALNELLESELGDYSFFKDYNISHEDSTSGGYEYFTVEILSDFVEHDSKIFSTLYFRVTGDVVEIDMSDDDTWEQVKYYDSTVKYLWMKILKWE